MKGKTLSMTQKIPMHHLALDWFIVEFITPYKVCQALHLQ